MLVHIIPTQASRKDLLHVSLLLLVLPNHESPRY
ncbi:hypothetical protein BVRB_5g100840 [Beta vulgaris subsp. vulgaris]|nr:hypothetical protein BVRB_5g100840 [Beta vulgaris subsp. vulgaris]